jgi:PAS domain S-box-containing protein
METPKRHTALLHEAGYLLLGLVSLATVTGLYFWLDVPLVAAAFTYLVVLVLLSLVSNLSSSIVLSFIGVGCLSYFFAPPIYSFRVDYPQDLITISAFVITSFVVNFLVTRVRGEQRDHMRTCETLRDANQRLEVTNKTLRIENVERKRAEQALRESEDKLRQIMDTAPGLTWSTGSDGSDGKKGEVQPRFVAQVQAILNVLPTYTWYSAPSGGLTFVNERTAEYLGVPKDHPLRFGIDIGAQWDDWVPLLHPDDQEEARKYWSNLLRTGEGGEHSYRVRSAQGDYRWFLTRIEPLRASDGTLLLWFGVTLDIEELKRAEEGLRESEANFRDYAETASDWFWEIDPDYKFTLLTENAFGSHAADRIGTACWDHALDLETEPEKWRLVRATLDSRKPFREFVYRGLSGNGSPMYVKVSGKPVFDANGEFLGYRGTGTDVTALMRAQEQQTAISEVLRAIVNSPHDLQPIFDAILDSATRLCRADSGALRLSEEGGLRLVAVRGDPFLVSQVWSLIPVLAEKGSLPDRLAESRLPAHIPDFTAVEGDHRDDFWITVVNAGIRTALFVPLLKDNEIVGIISLARKQVQPFTDKQISLFRDFAAQATIALESTRLERRYREAQMALAHANRVATMGQLTASITHEVNQPITAAVTYALAARRFLSADPPNFREVDDALSLIVKEGNRAGEVVGRVRALIKKVPPRKDAVAIDDAILEVIALTRTEAANNSVSVRTQFAEGFPRVQGDRVQLQQVMLNLILNAIQSMSGVADGNRELQISIDAVPSEGSVRVGVRDTGPGLSPESLPRLFEPFYTTKPEGMGMGLSICRSIIEAHGGRLWATGCEPRGALFQFTIPAD